MNNVVHYNIENISVVVGTFHFNINVYPFFLIIFYIYNDRQKNRSFFKNYDKIQTNLTNKFKKQHNIT